MNIALIISFICLVHAENVENLLKTYPFLRRIDVETLTNEFQLLQPQNIKRDVSAIIKSRAGNYPIEPYPLNIDNDDIVTVSFYSPNPNQGDSSTAIHNDWIGAYSPADIDITTTVPVKYGYCDDSPDYVSTGILFLFFSFFS